MVNTSVPHQSTGSGAEYAVSTKVATKSDRVTGNAVNQQKGDQGVCVYIHINVYYHKSIKLFKAYNF